MRPLAPRSPIFRWAVGAALTALAACSPDGPGLMEPSTPPTPPAIHGDLAPELLLPGVCNYDLDQSSLIAEGWTKVFDEGFAGGLAQWNVWTGGAFNEELQYYQAANLATAGGQLNIAARREAVTGATNPWDQTPKAFAYTSGRIESRPVFSASRTTPRVRLTARLRLPAGYGMWPAFWSYGDRWPTSGEIDVMEARGQEPFRYQTAYWYGRRAGVNLVRSSEAVITSGVSLADCWHVYEVVWSKTSLTYYLDGQAVDVKSGDYVSNLYGKKQWVTLNLAVGGLFFPDLDPALIQPGVLEADWVRVFTAR